MSITVFISYATEDYETAKRLYDDLEKSGINAWFDRENLLPGQYWRQEIPRVIRQCDYFLLLISDHSVSRDGYIQKEQRIALDVFEEKALNKIFIIPVRIDGTEPIDERLRNLHWADLTDYGKGLKQILRVFEEGDCKPEKPAASVSKAPEPPGPIVDISSLPETDAELFGRNNELEILDAAWNTPETNLVVLVAWGGVGKTALVNQWMNHMKKDNYRGAQQVYGISFYSQGAAEGKQASAEPFIMNALKRFKDPNPEDGDFAEKARRLAELIQRRKTLLILDGLEPLQYPPGSEQGRLKDHNLKRLLKHLANDNPGLCVITTRLWTQDLNTWEGGSVRRIDLTHLEPADGASLLKHIGVVGNEKELIKASEEFQGHALALTLLGTYLKKVYNGDVRQRDNIRRMIKPMIRQGKHAEWVLKSYEKWMDQSETGKRQLGILRITGLFDRPAQPNAVNALLKEPEIKGLTDELMNIPHDEWQFAADDLTELRLISSIDGILDTHPLIREYFGEQLKNGNPAAWKQAHSRLYEYYKALPKKQLPDTLEEMEPLFAAVAHGCQAERHQEALYDVFWERIRRKEEAYSVKKLGAFGSDLAAVSNFFENLWTKPADGLTDGDKAVILSWAGFRLRALGRLREAAQPMQAGLEAGIKQEDWKGAAQDAGNLSELWLTIGDVPQAVSYSRQSVEFADKSGDWGSKMMFRTTLADALHQSNDISESLRLFEEAEAMQKENQPEYSYLYSLWGFRYCDLLLSQGKYREVAERAGKTLEYRNAGWYSLLDIALDTLSLGKAYLLQTQEQATHNFTQAEKYLNQAVEAFVKAGQIQELPRGLLSRAELYRLKREFPKARADLDEAFEISDRSGMRLFLTDYHLESCRLRLAEGNKEEAKKHLETAEVLVNETGYHRRDKEIEEVYDANEDMFRGSAGN